MNRTQFWISTVLAASALLLAGANVLLGSMNRSLQADIGQRQQYVQQSVQLDGLYREIIRALAELGARNNDEAVRALLGQHGITYTVNPPAAAGTTPAPKK
jgi:sensor domain CHASE-containing protein